jgi:putative redox protein
MAFEVRSSSAFRYNRRVAKAVKPPTVADLKWIDELKFSVTVDKASLTIDSAGVAGPSPVDSLAAALGACMATDVTHVLTKGRHPLRGLRAHFVGHRAQEDPHRFLRIDLHFTIDGGVPAAAVERAIALSREKYCSVWHSMRQDIDFHVTFEVVRGQEP